jgi:hypothetical protein
MPVIMPTADMTMSRELGAALLLEVASEDIKVAERTIRCTDKNKAEQLKTLRLEVEDIRGRLLAVIEVAQRL